MPIDFFRRLPAYRNDVVARFARICCKEVGSKIKAGSRLHLSLGASIIGHSPLIESFRFLYGGIGDIPRLGEAAHRAFTRRAAPCRDDTSRPAETKESGPTPPAPKSPPPAPRRSSQRSNVPRPAPSRKAKSRSEEHTSELQS